MTPSVHLPPVTYYRLRYLQATAETAEARAQLAVMHATVAMQAYTHALTEAGQAHDFDSTQAWTWHDAQTALVPPDAALRKD